VYTISVVAQVSVEDAIAKYFLAQRYASAWQEINARVQSRQTVNVTFTVVTSAGVLALLTAVMRQTITEWSEYFCLWPPFVAWSFAFWIRHNEAAIGLLSALCAACERFVDPENSSGVPAGTWKGSNGLSKLVTIGADPIGAS
jgi:hypothetical protein